MSTFFRYTTLLLFAALGAGMAVYIAENYAPAEPAGVNSSPSAQRGESLAPVVNAHGPGAPASSVATAVHQKPALGDDSGGFAQPAVAAFPETGAPRIGQPSSPYYMPPAAGPFEHSAGAAPTPYRADASDAQPEAAGQTDSLKQALDLVKQLSQQNSEILREAIAARQREAAQLAQANAPAAAAPNGAQPAAGNLPPVHPLPPGVNQHDIAQPAPDAGRGKAEVRREANDDLTLNIQDADIREVLELISKAGNLNILASKSVKGRVSASLSGVSIDTALEAILKSTGFVARREGKFIYVGSPQDFEDMDQTLDRVSTRIYRPNYARAADIKALLTPVLTPGSGTISVSSPSQVGIPVDQVKAGGDDFAGAEVVLVRDYEMVLQQCDQIVAEVDRQPLQVSIEARILSVRLDDSLAQGVDFELLRDKNHIRVVSGQPLTDLGQIDLTQDGLKVGFLDSSLSVFVQALEKIGETNVVAAPHLLCLNKQKAEIHIGSQLGYVSTTVTENASTQQVEFLEVGTQLRLRPFISQDGMIRLEVHPELSTGSVTVEEGFTLPNKDVTQVHTNVLCRDGCTVVIGGLIREDLSTTASQIPWLGSLPLLGVAFRQQTESIDRREIIVLLTPRIVGEHVACSEGDKASCEYHTRQATYANEMSHLGTRHLGRRYVRLAKSSLAGGERQAALRYADLAVHYDPTNHEATNLRAELQAASRHGGPAAGVLSTGAPSTGNPSTMGQGPWQSPLQGGQISEWVLDELNPPATGHTVPETVAPPQP